ncbi:DUF305 domain-containing protein [Nocardioides massiliensis]|uniref:Uncharacterized protein (DUF305 family) n=1 Tax=Nocardioides massiliensis TaxID=1325935 RepID=A0ABT9NS70_9ACTN|nr:DUF305 domain-containing protein [Nocardioides massiliensis]MDP9823264.1 uncharacterized protein (DUF305 family) [Nocardioides massiliensis]
MIKKLIALLIALTTAFGLAACGNGTDNDSSSGSSSEIAEDEDFNQADVDFATEMIQHHAQALSMVDLIEGKDVSPELATLAEQIRMAQGPEIETLAGWLRDWSQPIPETTRDHANAHGDGGMEMDSDMPGMMSAEDMDSLESAEGAEFERMWLEMMIEHHEGAVEMAETEKEDGKFPDAVELADTIITGQAAEIDEMKSMLGS